jgi:tetratricopeptide (TPR) repeat protein
MCYNAGRCDAKLARSIYVYLPGKAWFIARLLARRTHRLLLSGAALMLDEFQREEALIHLQRGLVLERANRVEEAVEEYRRALSHYPYLREARDALGFYYQRHGLLAKAAEEFRAVASFENDFVAHFNLGYVLLELARYDEALTSFQRCLAIEPNDPATHYEIGYIHFQRGDYPAALQQLEWPLRYYPDDWEVHNLIGNCYLRLGAYDDALAAFERAERLAPPALAQGQLRERIATVVRYREIGTPHWAKDRLYAEHGVACLGSAQDDGQRIEELHEYHFTYPDIGTTIQRLLALCESCGWHFSCVVALDRVAWPLADALAQLMGIPQRRTGELAPGELPLLVLAIGREAELLDLAEERLPGKAIAFCLGLNWLRHNQRLPDLIGVIARGACSVPWEPELRRLRSDGATHDQIGACLNHAARQIVDAAEHTHPEPNRDRQTDYYCSHNRLRFVGAFAQA